MEYFNYKKEALDYLSKKDKKLALVIKSYGYIKREIKKDLFDGLIYIILGQQISKAAHLSIYNKLRSFKALTPCNILSYDKDILKSFGIGNIKGEYLKNIASFWQENSDFISKIKLLSNEEIMQSLIKIKGIGTWSVEMFLIFCLQKEDILSYKDLAIIRGLKMLYNHKDINKELFLKYQKRYAPFNSIASFYLWEISRLKQDELMGILKA